MRVQNKRLLAPSQLSQPQVDNLLQTSGLKFSQRPSGVWRLDKQIGLLEIDLSIVRHADLKALAQLATAIVAGGNDIGTVRIVPPSEPKVKSFIQHSNFAQCLQNAPGAQFTVETELSMSPRGHYLSIMPLTWLTDDHSYEALLNNLLRQPAANVAIGSADGRDLANVVLTEFFDNVRDHSGAAGALVAAWSQKDAHYLDPRYYYKEEMPYFDSLRTDRVGQLHMYIADPGFGIPYTLGPLFPGEEALSVLAHAFGRWSSSVDRSETRGTRGLYRVDRITRRHRGLVSLRSGQDIAGRCYSAGAGFERFAFQAGYSLPGTHVRLELPLSIPTVNLAQGSSLVDIDERSIGGKNREDRKNELYEVFSNFQPGDPTRTSTTVIVLNLNSQTLSHLDAVDFLLDVAEMAHPAPTAVIGLGMSDDALFNAAQDATEYIDLVRTRTEHKDDFRSFEPFVCIASTFQLAHWVGLSKSTGEMINTNPESLPTDVVRQLSGYSMGRFNVSGDWQPTLSGNTLWASAKRDLAIAVDANTRSQHGWRYIAPSLIAQPHALDLSAAVEYSAMDSGLISLLLTSQLAAEVPDVIARRPSLLFDDLVDEDVARSVASHLQGGVAARNSYQRVRPHDIEVSRDLGLDRSREVIVLVGLVASEQTARQLIALGLRQGYKVLGVLAIVETRRNRPAAIEVWKASFLVVAVLHRGAVLEGAGVDQHQNEFVNNRGKPEVPFAVDDLDLPTTEVIDDLGRAGAIHLGHFSGSVDRHFTFYVDAGRALSDGRFSSIILRAIATVISDWAPLQRQPLLILYPSTERRTDAPASRLALAVSAWLKSNSHIETSVVANDVELARTDEVIHLSWGSLSGVSVLTDIQDYCKRGVQKLLYIVLFSQGTVLLESHLRGLRRICFGRSEMDVEVRFIARLPVDTFPQETCPVCYQLASRGRWIHESYALAFAQEEQRLAVDTWRPGVNLGRSDSIAEKFAGSLAACLNSSALQRRGELVLAQRSVKDAYEWSQLLDSRISDPDWLFGLVTLLVYEPQWLRRPPLSQSNFRENLAKRLIAELSNASGVSISRDLKAKALICLRVVSKVYFAQNIARILISTREDPELFDLALYMVATILTRDYVAGTGLPGTVAGGLAVLRAELERLVPIPHDQLQALGILHDRATQLRLVLRINSIPRWESLQALDSRILEFPRHLVAGAFKRGLPGRWGGDAMAHLGDMLTEWNAIRAWFRENLLQYILLFRPLFRHTTALSNFPWLAGIFPGANERDSIEEIVRGLRASIKDPQHYSRSLKRTMYSVHRSIEELLAPETGVALLMTAIRQTRIPVSRVAERFAHECWNQGVLFSFDYDEYGDIQVLMPDRFLTELCLNLVSNAVTNFDEDAEPQGVSIVLKVGIDQSEDVNRVTLEFEHQGTLAKPRPPGKKGPGGLVELELMCPEFIRVYWSRAPFDRPFVVSVELDIGMRGLDDEV